VKTIKLVAFGAVVLIAVLVALRLLSSDGDPGTAAVVASPGIPVKPEKPHVRAERSVSPGTPRESEIRGRLRVKVKVPNRPAHPDGQGHDPPGETEMEFDVLIPKNEESPPIVVPVDTTAGTIILPTYEDFRDPFLTFRIHVLVGASVEPAIGPSPYGGVSILTIAERFRLGGGIDRFALGPAAYWEFWREFNLGVKLNLLKFKHEASTVNASISYRF
jgi:hypothetical protein